MLILKSVMKPASIRFKINASFLLYTIRVNMMVLIYLKKIMIDTFFKNKIVCLSEKAIVVQPK